MAAPDPMLRALARACAEGMGLGVAEAGDGLALEQAADAARQHPETRPDLILVDSELRDGGGGAAWQRLSERPGLVEIPILLIVPAGDPDPVARALELGIRDVVEKPIQSPVLALRLAAALALAGSQRALESTRQELTQVEALGCIAPWEYAVATEELHGGEALRSLLGLDGSEGPLSRLALRARLHAADRREFESQLEKAAEDGAGLALDTRLASPQLEVLREPGAPGERVLHWRAEAAREGGRITRLAGTVQDVTERSRAEVHARSLVNRDALTGLANRQSFIARLRTALEQSRRHGRSFAILFLDLDNFKRINDDMGHSMGDCLLQGLADRLERCVRQGDSVHAGRGDSDASYSGSVSRLGGDEFTVLLGEISKSEDAARVAERIIAAFREPFVVGQRELVVGTSIGITVYPSDGEDVDTLLRNADTAMYQAKEHGRNQFRFYSHSLNAKALRRLTLEQNLCRAFENHELQVYYQPQVELETGRICGVEALLRWDDPKLGAVSPAEFVPVAEGAGIITPIGEWVLRTSCWQLKSWREAGLPPVRLAVNISPHHFQDAGFVAQVGQTLWDTGVDATCLELEITENALMENQELVVTMLAELKALGVTIALDDFGTGYSSLSYLKRFPVDTVKIDRSFVRDIMLDPDDATITEAIISMARALRLRVVAEGVETESQREFLRRHRCDEYQGYVLSPPVTADTVAALLRDE